MKRLIFIVVSILILFISSCNTFTTDDGIVIGIEKVKPEEGISGRKFLVRVQGDNGMITQIYTNDILTIGDTVHLICTHHGKCNQGAGVE